MRKALLLCAFIFLAGSLHPQDQASDLETLILADDPEMPRFFDMTLLKGINMGIPGGDNWLVEWTGKRASSGTLIFVYLIDNDIIVERFRIGFNYDVNEDSDFDIMKDIPGTRIGTGSCVVYDYNGDGFDDIFNYAFGGRGYFIRIIGYDHEKNGMVDYADIPFAIVDRRDGPAPVEFIKYKGMEGFMVHYYLPEVAGGPGYIPDPSPKNDRWFFYAWDGEQRKYVEIEEVDPRYIGAEAEQVPEQERLAERQAPAAASVETPAPAVSEAAPPDAAAELPSAETAYPAIEGSSPGSRLSLITIVLIGGAVVLGVAVVLIVVRKKRCKKGD